MRAVGMCLGTTGATLAVVELTGSGWRLKTVAEVNWPGADPAARGAARLLGRARRRLGLPRRHAVTVTAPPGAAGHIDAHTAEILLARAGLVRGWTVDSPTAGENAVAAIGATLLAAGAAIATAATTNPPPRTPEPRPEPRPEPEPQPKPEPQPDPSLPDSGWAVQRVADPGRRGAESTEPFAAEPGRHPLDDIADIARTRRGGSDAGARHGRRGVMHR